MASLFCFWSRNFRHSHTCKWKKPVRIHVSLSITFSTKAYLLHIHLNVMFRSLAFCHCFYSLRSLVRFLFCSPNTRPEFEVASPMSVKAGVQAQMKLSSQMPGLNIMCRGPGYYRPTISQTLQSNTNASSFKFNFQLPNSNRNG